MLWSKVIGAGGAGGVVEGWNISTAVYLQNFSVAAQSAQPFGVFFKPDGTKMYITGSSSNVNEYDLGTAWDVTTSVFLQSKNVSTEDLTPYDVSFKPDGTKMFVLGFQGDDVNEYDLSTAWDISTAVYLQNFSVAAQSAQPFGVFFKPDGTKMYITGSSSNVNEYDLGTAWDVTTSVFLQSKNVSTEDLTPYDVSFKPDGTKMFVLGFQGDDVNEYDLSTAWDISTAVYLQNFSVAAQENNPRGIFFKPDGTKMYVTGLSAIAIQEYDLTA